MTLLSQTLAPLRARQSAALPAAAARAARCHRPAHPRRRRRAAARARSGRRVRRLAHHRAQGDRRSRERRPAGAPPGLRHVRARTRREEFLEADLVLGGHARARPHAAQRMAQALERHGHARGSADAALEPWHAGVSFSSPAFRRRRADGARVRDDRRRCLPSLDAVETSLYEALERRATGRCVRCSVCAPCCSRASRPSCCAPNRRRRAARRTSRISADGRAVEFSQSYYRGDTYDFVAELSTP